VPNTLGLVSFGEKHYEELFVGGNTMTDKPLIMCAKRVMID
jgi:hypothetical protein